MKNDLVLHKDAVLFNSFREFIDNSVSRNTNKTAFKLKKVENGLTTYKDITYSMFKEEINYLGQAFIDMGLKNKRIGIVGANSYEWVLTYMTTLYGVGTVVPLDKGLQEEELKALLIRSDVDAIVFDKKHVDTIKELKENKSTNIKEFIYINNTDDNLGFINMHQVIENGKQSLHLGKTDIYNASVDSNKLGILLFTSGTTALAKGVMLSQMNVLTNVYALECNISVEPNDVALTFLPLHHTFGATGFLFFFHNGTCTTFCDGLRHIQENLKEYNVSVFMGVPLILEAMQKRIFKQLEKQNKIKLVNRAAKLCNFLLKFGIDIRRKVFKPILDQLGGNLHFVISGAAPIDPNTNYWFNNFGIKTIQGYGLTETSPVICAENDKYTRYGSCGFPVKDVEIDIVNKNEKGIGELIARGPNVMLGYYNNEEATNEVIKNGWFHTGDLASIDKDGYVFIHGREKNVIVLKNGKNIYPEELEQLVGKLPYVKECMAFGLPKDNDLVVSIKVVYNTDVVKQKYNNMSYEDFKELVWNDIKAINKSLPTYKYMKHLFLTDKDMIKTTTAKVKRYQEIEKTIKEAKEKNEL